MRLSPVPSKSYPVLLRVSDPRGVRGLLRFLARAGVVATAVGPFVRVPVDEEVLSSADVLFAARAWALANDTTVEPADYRF